MGESGTPIQITIDFSFGMTEVRRKWHISQVLKEKNGQPQMLYLVKISLKNE